MSWPGYDPFYNHNTVDNNGRKNFYSVSAVPKTKLDGYYQPTGLSVMESYYNSQVAAGASASISLFGEYDYGTNLGSYVILVNTDADIYDGQDYKLFVALTEDPTVYGSNYYDTLRAMFPTYNGVVVDIGGTAPKTALVQGNFTVDASYVEDNLRLVAWVQPTTSPTKVINATSSFLNMLPDPTDVVVAPAQFELGRNFPNPFNPTTTVPVKVKEAGIALVEVVTADGRRVRVLHEGMLDAGNHDFVWDGTNDAGQSVASGVYMTRLIGATERQMERMVLLK